MCKHLFVLICTLCIFGTVLAHADLVESVPLPGAVLAESPAEISLSFTGTLSTGSSIRLFTDDFQNVPVGSTMIDSEDTSRLFTSVSQPLPAGRYTVQWDVIFADGHQLSGSYQFAVRENTTLQIILLSSVVLAAIGGLSFLISRRVGR